MKTQNFLVGLLTVGISLSASGAIAVPIANHAYATERAYSSTTDITGSQVTYSTGTDALAYNSTQGFIDKEMWANLGIGSVGCWLETGMTKGAIMPTLQSNENNSQRVFQNGHFIGYKSINQSTGQPEYHDAPYGVTTGVIGPQIYTIEKISGNGNWRILVNGVTALTLNSVVCANGAATYLANGSNYSTVGIEASDSAAVFTNPSVASGWVVRKVGSSYQTLNSANNLDQGPLVWASQFRYFPNTNTNAVGFAR